MSWKSVFIISLIASAAAAFLPAGISPARADSIVTLRCHSAECEFEQQLAESETTQYVPVCANKERAYVRKVSVKNKNKKTSCTSRCHGSASNTFTYSKVCTNQNPDSIDKVKVVIQCGKRPLSSNSAAGICR